jgi:geranylgeranyl pyrophosphate synthase
MNFNEKYIKIKNLALRESATIEENMDAQINIREPLRFSLRKYLIAPVKRIRPLLAILYTNALGEELNK